MHDPQGEVESNKEGLKKQEGPKPDAKDPSSELAKVSRSHEHMLCQPRHSCCHCSVSPVAFFCFLRKHLYMHDPQGEVESNKEGLKKQEGLAPVAKDPWAEPTKVSRSHEHMLSQPCRFLRILVLSHLLPVVSPLYLSFHCVLRKCKLAQSWHVAKAEQHWQIIADFLHVLQHNCRFAGCSPCTPECTLYLAA